jgi:hypothetical protein
VLTDDRLRGLEYGMLRDFLDEIVRVTGASRVAAPEPYAASVMYGRLAHGTRYAPLRALVPRRPVRIEADVLWVVLMGPEASQLDGVQLDESAIGKKILYLFDSFQFQLPVIRRLLAATKWDFAITSFPAAVPMLERETGHKWHAVPQGVRLERFVAGSYEERVIPFCSYGRRLPAVHDALRAYADATGRYYDYTTWGSAQAGLEPRESYKQYAWHLGHSLYSICWPVELTNPARAGAFSPITCRWFEVAASGATLVGKLPTDPALKDALGFDDCIEVDPQASAATLRQLFDRLWEERRQHAAAAAARRAALSERWSWERRVRTILSLAGLGSAPA